MMIIIIYCQLWCWCLPRPVRQIFAFYAEVTFSFIVAWAVELRTFAKITWSFTITGKAPTRSFSWLGSFSIWLWNLREPSYNLHLKLYWAVILAPDTRYLDIYCGHIPRLGRCNAVTSRGCSHCNSVDNKLRDKWHAMTSHVTLCHAGVMRNQQQAFQAVAISASLFLET